jgi:hypothetical protein
MEREIIFRLVTGEFVDLLFGIVLTEFLKTWRKKTVINNRSFTPITEIFYHLSKYSTTCRN